MTAFFGLLSVSGLLLGFLWLILNFIKKRTRKKPMIMLVICLALLVTCLILPDNGVNKLKKYEWGTVVIEKLQEFGAEEVKSFKTLNEYGSTIFIDIETDKTKLYFHLSYGHAGFDTNGIPFNEWSVYHVSNSDNRDIVYYSEGLYFEGKPSYDIYDYRTGEILIAADSEAKAKREESGRDNLKRIQDGIKEQKKQEDEQSKVIVAEIYHVYKSNKLVADDTYKGNYYTVTGIMETVKDDGLINTLFREIGVVVSVIIDNQSYNVFCKFDKSERDNLKKYSSGDLIKFTGECISWNDWVNCKVVD